VRLTFHGTRGSLPSPGEATNRYGGNTSCVMVQNDEDQVLILDAGSGIRQAGEAIPPGTKRVDVLLTHLHMDHIQGLGFFAPLYTPGVQVHIWGPPSTTRSLRKRLTRYLSPPLFPVRIREVPSLVRCHDVTRDGWDIGAYRLQGHLITHPGPTLGYRIECGGRTLAYLPDHEPQLGCPAALPKADWLSGFSVAAGADLLVHDAQYTAEEYRTRAGWGHCTAELAVRYAEAVAAKRLLFFHFDPARSDDDLERVCSDAASTHKGTIDIAPAAESTSHEV